MGSSTRQPESPPGMATNDQFHELYVLYWAQVHRFFLRKGCRFEEARDLTQDVFCRVYTGMEDFREESRVTTWIYTIAQNRYANMIRSRRTDKRSGEEVSVEALAEQGVEPTAEHDPRRAEPASPESSALVAERRRVLRGALEELPPKMRQAVRLRLDQGLKYREIATIMGVSIQTVKSQLFQARQRLRTLLGEYFEPDDLAAIGTDGDDSAGGEER